MISKEKSKLVVEKTIPKPVVDENTEALELYKKTTDTLKKTADMLEQMDIALGRNINTARLNKKLRNQP